MTTMSENGNNGQARRSSATRATGAGSAQRGRYGRDYGTSSPRSTQRTQSPSTPAADRSPAFVRAQQGNAAGAARSSAQAPTSASAGEGAQDGLSASERRLQEIMNERRLRSDSQRRAQASERPQRTRADSPARQRSVQRIPADDITWDDEPSFAPDAQELSSSTAEGIQAPSASPTSRQAAPSRSIAKPRGPIGQAGGQGGFRLPSMPSAQRGPIAKTPAGQYLGMPANSRPALPIARIAIAVVALLVVIAGVNFILNSLPYKVTVNGQESSVKRGATVQTAIESGLASPKAGNLLAVDGSVITEGGGDAFAATINGEQTTDPEAALPKNATVEIADGADITETFQTSEEPIEHGTASSSTEPETYWAGSLHVYSKGEDGVRTVKTGDISGKTASEDTKPAVPAGYNVYTANPGDDKVIALTFDDGPWPDYTKQILDILEENGAKATFFTIGNQVADHTDQVKRAKELGCQICTHTWDHADGSGEGVNLTYMSQDEQIEEVQKGYKAIKEATGEEPAHIMRAPGGNYYGDLISTLEPYVDAEIGWDTDTEDWRQPGYKSIYNAIMGTKSGGVVLMHDGGGDRSQTVKAVKKAVPKLISKGYKLVTVDELLAYPAPTS